MALDDILKGVEMENMLSGIGKTLANDASNPDALHQFVSYIAQTEPDNGSRELAATNEQVYRQDLVRLREDVEVYKAREKSGLVQKVAGSYKELVKTLKGDELFGVAIGLKDKGKRYLDVMAKLQEGDVVGALKICADGFKIKENKEGVMKYAGNEKAAKRFLELYLDFQQEKWKNSKVSDPKGKPKKGENQEYTPNPAKAREYILKTIASYKKPEEKNAAYHALATAYHSANKKD